MNNNFSTKYGIVAISQSTSGVIQQTTDQFLHPYG